MRALAVIAAALAVAAPASAQLVRAPRTGDSFTPLGTSQRALIAVDASATSVETFALRAAGAELVSPPLGIWRVRTDVARVLLPGLRRTGAATAAAPDVRLRSFTHLSAGDPLIPQEWWLAAVGADRAEPPGPGVPVTVLDTGLDTSHPEFAGRPNVVLLNQQRVSGREEIHGTAVSSVVGAPANGVGLVGVYPEARLQEWDFGAATLADVLRALGALARRPRSVVNISGGFFCCGALVERAVDRLVAHGSVVVAAVGNERESESPQAVPASLPHVLTIAATDETDRVTVFSSSSGAVDLAAPGQDIPVAVPTYYDPTGFATLAGTSFSSPLVAGAAGWIWTERPQLTNTQIVDLVRSSARDVGRRGWDRDTGFGVLDIPRALAAPTPPLDPGEPNDDVFSVKPNGLTGRGATPLTAPSRPRTTLAGRIDYREDPEDVYRVWIPRSGRVVVRLHGTGNVDLALWGPATTSVVERGAALRRDLLGFSQRTRTATDVVSVATKRGRGGFGYADVFLPRAARRISYTLSVATTARR